MAKNILTSKVLFMFALGVAVLPGLGAGLAALSIVQQRFLPVIDRYEINEMMFDAKGDVIIGGQFYKLFPEWMCEYHSIRWFMTTENSTGQTLKLRVSADYADARRDPDDNNRFKGWNRFHGWKIEISEYPELPKLSGVAQHRCLWVFPAFTPLPALDLGPRPAMTRRVPPGPINPPYTPTFPPLLKRPK